MLLSLHESVFWLAAIRLSGVVIGLHATTSQCCTSSRHDPIRESTPLKATLIWFTPRRAFEKWRKWCRIQCIISTVRYTHSPLFQAKRCSFGQTWSCTAWNAVWNLVQMPDQFIFDVNEVQPEEMHHLMVWHVCWSFDTLLDGRSVASKTLAPGRTPTRTQRCLTPPPVPFFARNTRHIHVAPNLMASFCRKLVSILNELPQDTTAIEFCSF